MKGMVLCRITSEVKSRCPIASNLRGWGNGFPRWWSGGCGATDLHVPSHYGVLALHNVICLRGATICKLGSGLIGGESV